MTPFAISLETYSSVEREYLADRAADLAEAKEMELRRNKVNWKKEGF